MKDSVSFKPNVGNTTFANNSLACLLLKIQVLDLKSWTWSRVETKVATESEETSPTLLSPCAGHSLVSFFNLVAFCIGFYLLGFRLRNIQESGFNYKGKLTLHEIHLVYYFSHAFFVCFVDTMGQQIAVYRWSY